MENPGLEVTVKDDGGTENTPVDVLVGADSATLSSMIAELADRQVIFSDLSLGSWRGHQVARELCMQLRMSPPDALDLADSDQERLAAEFPSYADLTATGIDAEASDDHRVVVTFAAATGITEVIRRRGPHAAVVLAPRFGTSWHDEDVLLLRFLTALLGEEELRVVVVTTSDAPALPAGLVLRRVLRTDRAAAAPPEPTGERHESVMPPTIFALIPGVVEPQVRAVMPRSVLGAGAGLLRLAENVTLIGPEHRRPPAAVPQHEYDWLAVLAAPVPWLAAYAQCFSTEELVTPWLLLSEARRRWAEGVGCLALRLADRASTAARTTQDRERLHCWAQGIRIALHRFEELAAAPLADDGSAVAARGFLHEAKGWGLVMSGRPVQAEAYLRKAQELLSPYAASREYLYLMNISALCRLRLGDAPEALRIEEAIGERADLLTPTDWSLRYLNALNIGRLHRYLGDIEAARCHYARAFDVTLGTRSTSELLYTNITLGRVAAAAGHPDQAFLHMLRACMHWLASRVPEAVGSRTLAAVLSQRWPLRSRPTVAEVVAALEEQLIQAAVAAGHAAALAEAPGRDEAPGPLFERSDVAAARGMGTRLTAVSSEGVGFFAMEYELSSRPPSLEQRRLATLVRTLLAARCSNAGVQTAATIIVDDLQGRDAPASTVELAQACLRLGARSMLCSGQLVALDDECRSYLERNSLVRLGSAVARLDTTTPRPRIVYKRLLPPRVVHETEQPLVEGLLQSHTIPVPDFQTHPEDSGEDRMRLITTLEADRVLTVDLTPEACREVGITVAG